MKLSKKVKIKDPERTRSDELMDEEAKEIIRKCDYCGTVTKVEDGINFVGFWVEDGWVTQGFKDDEIEVIE